MSVVDLGHVPAVEPEESDGAVAGAQGSEPSPSAGLLLPERGERTGVTLPELLHLVEHLGVALPFALPSTGAGTLADRLGAGRAPLRDLLAAFPDPRGTLLERGLLARPRTAPEPGGPDRLVVLPWLAHALRVLNGAEVSVDLEVSLAGATVRSWHHAAGDVVTALSSADGIVYEVALVPLARWHDELQRVVTPPEQSDHDSPADAPRGDRPHDRSPMARLSGDGDQSGDPAAVPDGLQLPLELLMAGTQALEEGRSDVVDELLRRYAGQSTLLGAHTALDGVEVLRHLQGLGRAVGRVRALVTSRSATPAAAGVLSWTLLGDGWVHLNPIGTKDDPQVRLDRVEPADLGPCLSPLIAQVLP